MSVSQVGHTVSSMISNAPLPQMVESLGISIAQAQAALDENSIAMATRMAATEVDVGGNTFNLISLGFMPTFYAFTEATIEAKIAFSMTKSREFSAGLEVGVNLAVVAVSVEASYSQKFSMSSEGSSSIAARLVSLPAPEVFKDILKQEYQTKLTTETEP